MSVRKAASSALGTRSPTIRRSSPCVLASRPMPTRWFISSNSSRPSAAASLTSSTARSRWAEVMRSWSSGAGCMPPFWQQAAPRTRTRLRMGHPG
nr:hypothetical protein [Tessaracoccus coleopterorum]